MYRQEQLVGAGNCKVPVQDAKRVVGNKQFGGARHIPLKVNSANVMPIIFAQAIMFLPISLYLMMGRGENSAFMRAMTDMTGFGTTSYLLFLSYYSRISYTAITINPATTDDLKRNNGFIPGGSLVSLHETISMILWIVLLCQERFSSHLRTHCQRLHSCEAFPAFAHILC